MRLAPGTASAISRACAGGVAGSSRPATSSVGAVMRDSASRMSKAASASQQAAYAAGSASRRSCEQRAATGGVGERGENQSAWAARRPSLCALLAHQLRPLPPGRRARRSAAEEQTHGEGRDPLGVVRGQMQADGAAEGDARVGEAVDSRARRRGRARVRPGRRRWRCRRAEQVGGGAAVARQVPADHPVGAGSAGSCGSQTASDVPREGPSSSGGAEAGPSSAVVEQGGSGAVNWVSRVRGAPQRVA